MRILVVTERLGGIGGAERYLDTLLAALTKRGDVVRVLAREIATSPSGIDAELVAWSDEHDEPAAAARDAVRRAIASFRPDVALAENVMDAGILEALNASRHATYRVHDHRPFCPNGDRVFPRSGKNCTAPLGLACALHAVGDGCAYGPRASTLRLIARRRRLRDAIAASQRVIVGSRYVRACAAASGVPSARIEIVPPPLPDEAFAGDVTPSRERAIVFAGRVVPQKGLASLARALATITPARRPLLHVLGDGPALAGTIREAERLGLALQVHGPASPEHVRSVIDAAALAVVPSVWAEPFGLVGIEAFARGRPVVAYLSGGISDWLRDGENGIAVPLGDEPALGAAIARLLDDDALGRRLGARARQDAEAFRLAPKLETYLGVSAGR